MKGKPIPQFSTTVLMLVALFSMSLVLSGASSWTVNHQNKVRAVPTVEIDIAAQTPTIAVILPTPEPVLSAGDLTELFSPGQISGGLQTTVRGVKWGTDSAVSSTVTGVKWGTDSADSSAANGVKWGTDSADSSVDPQSDSDWSDVTVSISVKCILKDGCQNISVMDYDLTYDEYVGDLIYGAQQEFGNTDLKPDEAASGSITFAIPSTAKTLALRYAPKPMTIAEFSK